MQRVSRPPPHRNSYQYSNTLSGDVYIILNALDEGQDQCEFLKLLEIIHGWELGTLHLLETSQQEQDISKVLNDLVSHKVAMNKSIDGDIRFHVSKTLDHDIKFGMYSEKDRKMVENTLTESVHRM